MWLTSFPWYSWFIIWLAILSRFVGYHEVEDRVHIIGVNLKNWATPQ